MSFLAETRASLEKELVALDTERDKLINAIAALSENGTASGPKSPPTSSPSTDAPATARRTRRSSRYTDDAILDVIRANAPDVPARVIRDHLGGNSNQLSMRLKKLVDGHQLVRKGERRASVYNPV